MSDLLMLKFTTKLGGQPLLVNATNIASIRQLEAGGCYILYAVGSDWADANVTESVEDIEQVLREVGAGA